jgi:serine/threonine protein kinase
MTSAIEPGAPEGCTPGQVIAGELVIQRELGRGGVGIVYLATHRTLKAEVAVKILRHEHRRRAEVVEKFRAEGRALWELEHPSFVKVLHAGEDAVVGPFIVMEVLRGATVRDLLARFTFEPEQVVELLIEVTDAAQSMHDLGIIHRDLKPENLFIQARTGESVAERVKILDLGVAKISRYETPGTSENRTMGTGRYMSPEHVRCEPLTPASDVYALAHIAFELLTGEHPFEPTARTPSDLEFQTFHLMKPTRRLVDLRPEEPELSSVLEQAMSKSVDGRFQSMTAFGRALAEATRQRKIRASRGATVKLESRASTPGHVAAGDPPTIEQALTDLIGPSDPTHPGALGPATARDATRSSPDRVIALLVERRTDGSVQTHELCRGEFVVGRLPSVDVQLEHPSVSGRHARLVVHASSILELFDDGSGAGTTVNGKRVSYALLKHGDRVQFGALLCEVQLVDPSALELSLSETVRADGPSAAPVARARGPTPPPAALTPPLAALSGRATPPKTFVMEGRPPEVARAVEAAKGRSTALAPQQVPGGPTTLRMPSAPPANRSRTWVWVVGTVLFLAAVAIGAYHAATRLLP